MEVVEPEKPIEQINNTILKIYNDLKTSLPITYYPKILDSLHQIISTTMKNTTSYTNLLSILEINGIDNIVNFVTNMYKLNDIDNYIKNRELITEYIETYFVLLRRLKRGEKGQELKIQIREIFQKINNTLAIIQELVRDNSPLWTLQSTYNNIIFFFDKLYKEEYANANTDNKYITNSERFNEIKTELDELGNESDIIQINQFTEYKDFFEIIPKPLSYYAESYAESNINDYVNIDIQKLLGLLNDMVYEYETNVAYIIINMPIFMENKRGEILEKYELLNNFSKESTQFFNDIDKIINDINSKNDKIHSDCLLFDKYLIEFKKSDKYLPKLRKLLSEYEELKPRKEKLFHDINIEYSNIINDKDLIVNIEEYYDVDLSLKENGDNILKKKKELYSTKINTIKEKIVNMMFEYEGYVNTISNIRSSVNQNASEKIEFLNIFSQEQVNFTGYLQSIKTIVTKISILTNTKKYINYYDSLDIILKQYNFQESENDTLVLRYLEIINAYSNHFIKYIRDIFTLLKNDYKTILKNIHFEFTKYNNEYNSYKIEEPLSNIENIKGIVNKLNELIKNFDLTYTSLNNDLTEVNETIIDDIQNLSKSSLTLSDKIINLNQILFDIESSNNSLLLEINNNYKIMVDIFLENNIILYKDVISENIDDLTAEYQVYQIIEYINDVSRLYNTIYNSILSVYNTPDINPKISIYNTISRMIDVLKINYNDAKKIVKFLEQNKVIVMAKVNEVEIARKKDKDIISNDISNNIIEIKKNFDEKKIRDDNNENIVKIKQEFQGIDKKNEEKKKEAEKKRIMTDLEKIKNKTEKTVNDYTRKVLIQKKKVALLNEREEERNRKNTQKEKKQLEKEKAKEDMRLIKKNENAKIKKENKEKKEEEDKKNKIARKNEKLADDRAKEAMKIKKNEQKERIKELEEKKESQQLLVDIMKYYLSPSIKEFGDMKNDVIGKKEVLDNIVNIYNFDYQFYSKNRYNLFKKTYIQIESFFQKLDKDYTKIELSIYDYHTPVISKENYDYKFYGDLFKSFKKDFSYFKESYYKQLNDNYDSIIDLFIKDMIGIKKELIEFSDKNTDYMTQLVKLDQTKISDISYKEKIKDYVISFNDLFNYIYDISKDITNLSTYKTNKESIIDYIKRYIIYLSNIEKTLKKTDFDKLLNLISDINKKFIDKQDLTYGTVLTYSNIENTQKIKDYIDYIDERIKSLKRFDYIKLIKNVQINEYVIKYNNELKSIKESVDEIYESYLTISISKKENFNSYKNQYSKVILFIDEFDTKTDRKKQLFNQMMNDIILYYNLEMIKKLGDIVSYNNQYALHIEDLIIPDDKNDPLSLQLESFNEFTKLCNQYSTISIKLNSENDGILTDVNINIIETTKDFIKNLIDKYNEWTSQKIFRLIQDIKEKKEKISKDGDDIKLRDKLSKFIIQYKGEYELMFKLYNEWNPDSDNMKIYNMILTTDNITEFNNTKSEIKKFNAFIKSTLKDIEKINKNISDFDVYVNKNSKDIKPEYNKIYFDTINLVSKNRSLGNTLVKHKDLIKIALLNSVKNFGLTYNSLVRKSTDYLKKLKLVDIKNLDNTNNTYLQEYINKLTNFTNTSYTFPPDNQFAVDKNIVNLIIHLIDLYKSIDLDEIENFLENIQSIGEKNTVDAFKKKIERNFGSSIPNIINYLNIANQYFIDKAIELEKKDIISKVSYKLDLFATTSNTIISLKKSIKENKKRIDKLILSFEEISTFMDNITNTTTKIPFNIISLERFISKEWLYFNNDKYISRYTAEFEALTQSFNADTALFETLYYDKKEYVLRIKEQLDVIRKERNTLETQLEESLINLKIDILSNRIDTLTKKSIMKIGNPNEPSKKRGDTFNKIIRRIKRYRMMDINQLKKDLNEIKNSIKITKRKEAKTQAEIVLSKDYDEIFSDDKHNFLTGYKTWINEVMKDMVVFTVLTNKSKGFKYFDPTTSLYNLLLNDIQHDYKIFEKFSTTYNTTEYMFLLKTPLKHNELNKMRLNAIEIKDRLKYFEDKMKEQKEATNILIKTFDIDHKLFDDVVKNLIERKDMLIDKVKKILLVQKNENIMDIDDNEIVQECENLIKKLSTKNVMDIDLVPNTTFTNLIQNIKLSIHNIETYYQFNISKIKRAIEDINEKIELNQNKKRWSDMKHEINALLTNKQYDVKLLEKQKDLITAFKNDIYDEYNFVMENKDKNIFDKTKLKYSEFERYITDITKKIDDTEDLWHKINDFSNDNQKINKNTQLSSHIRSYIRDYKKGFLYLNEVVIDKLIFDKMMMLKSIYDIELSKIETYFKNKLDTIIKNWLDLETINIKYQKIKDMALIDLHVRQRIYDNMLLLKNTIEEYYNKANILREQITKNGNMDIKDTLKEISYLNLENDRDFSVSLKQLEFEIDNLITNYREYLKISYTYENVSKSYDDYDKIIHECKDFQYIYKNLYIMTKGTNFYNNTISILNRHDTLLKKSDDILKKMSKLLLSIKGLETTTKIIDEWKVYDEEIQSNLNRMLNMELEIKEFDSVFTTDTEYILNILDYEKIKIDKLEKKLLSILKKRTTILIGDIKEIIDKINHVVERKQGTPNNEYLLTNTGKGSYHKIIIDNLYPIVVYIQANKLKELYKRIEEVTGNGLIMRQWDINKKEIDFYYNKLSTFLNGIDFIMKIDTKKLFKKELIEKILFVVDKIRPKKEDKDKEEDEKKFEYNYDKKKEFDYKYYIEQINDIYEDFNNIYDTFKVDDDLKKSDKRQEKLLKKMLDHNKTISIKYNSLIGLVIEILKHFKQFKKHDIDSFNILFDRNDITVDLDYEKKINIFVHSTKELSNYQLIPFFDIYIIKKNQTLNSWLQIKLNDPLFVFQKNDGSNYLIEELDNNPVTPNELQQTIKDLIFQYYKEESPIYIKKINIQKVIDYINQILKTKKGITPSVDVTYSVTEIQKLTNPISIDYKKPRILTIFNSIFDKIIIIVHDATRILLTYLISFYLCIQNYEYIEEYYSPYGNFMISYIEYILSISNNKGELIINIELYNKVINDNNVNDRSSLWLYLDKLFIVNRYSIMVQRKKTIDGDRFKCIIPSNRKGAEYLNKRVVDNFVFTFMFGQKTFLENDTSVIKGIIFTKYIVIDQKFNLWIRVDNVYQHKSFQKDQQITTNYIPNFDFFYIRS